MFLSVHSRRIPGMRCVDRNVMCGSDSVPKIPESWKLRRARKQRRVQYDALQRLGLATSGSPLSGETSLCIAYMCPYAYMCPKAAFRPALVSQRDCLRLYPEQMRPRSGLSEHAMDTLAEQRRSGQRLNPVTLSMLDQFRPAGPSPSFGLKRPPRPGYIDAPSRQPETGRQITPPRLISSVRVPGRLPRVFVPSTNG